MTGALIVVRPSAVPVLLVLWFLTHGHIFVGSGLLIFLILDAVGAVRMKIEELGSRGTSTPELEEDLRRHGDRLF